MLNGAALAFRSLCPLYPLGPPGAAWAAWARLALAMGVRIIISATTDIQGAAALQTSLLALTIPTPSHAEPVWWPSPGHAAHLGGPGSAGPWTCAPKSPVPPVMVCPASHGSGKLGFLPELGFFTMYNARYVKKL